MTFANKSDSTDPYVTTSVTADCLTHHHRHCISWSAVLSGALVAVGLSFILNLLGIAVGLTAFVSNEGSTSIAIGGFIAVIIGVIIVMFFSGFVAGHLGSRCCWSKGLGALYGFATWVISLIIVMIFASAFTQFVASYYHSLFGPNYSIKTTSYPTTAPALSADKNAVIDVNSNNATNKKDINVAIRDANVAKNANPEVAVNVSKAAASAVEQSLFAIFFIFLLGALASTLGGYFGSACACCNKKICSGKDCGANKLTPKDTI